MIFDTHCHLNSEELYPKIDEVIENAKNNGVGYFLVVGWNKESSILAVKIAEKYDFCYAAVGFHPTDINGVSAGDFDEIMALSTHPKVVAIGEIGLDYYWVKDLEERNRQKEWFIKQIEYANKARLPVTIHNRDAFGDCLEILKEHKPEYGGIMHCYSGSVESMKEVIDLGLMIGLGGPLTFKNAKTPKEVGEKVPLEKVVVETDSPYLSPHPLRGTTNEPKNVRLVLEELAKLKNLKIDELEDKILENSKKVFHV